MKGYITKGIGGFYYVKTPEGIVECKPRGIFRKQKITPVAGDEVTLETENGAAVIAEIAPRKNVFVRPPVANLDVLFLVASTTQPTPSTLVLDKLSAIAVDKGVQPGDYAADVLHTLTGQHQEWMAERLLEHGMPVEPDNYDALYACVSNQAVGAAKLLLDRGIDLEQYQLWAEHRPKGDGYTETMEELAAYWSELQNSTQPEDSPMKGMNL